ncbi:hypothetical protein BCR42DRAFT_168736 [Absidia repens]|uniref:START domain-containing protein n=1 Tax=Absidia repens TaxID=90262 RepID=A0A1X2IUM3_9FUNG|nr:hypothetical protein BCR42DRAFT_168736 [Absidia repens]
MSIHKSQRQYEQSLREAVDRYRHLTTINEWTLQKTEKKHLHHSLNISIDLWKYKDAHKVTLKNDIKTTPPSWSLNDWRSLLETDSLPGLNDMVEKKQVVAKLDKHTRVSEVKMKNGWKLGSHERLLIEQIIQHSNSLRYIATSTQQDDLIQTICLDIQYPTNQPGQHYNVTFFCQFAPDALLSTTTSEQLSNYSLSMITGSLTSLSSYTPIPFISHQDSGIQLDYNTYDPLTRTLDIKYHFGTTDDDAPDSGSLATTDTISIHRHLSPRIPSQSRSWDPPYEPVLPSSLRKHDFMSSSLVFRPSSPGAGAHRLPPITMTKKSSTVDLSSLYSSNALRRNSSQSISNGEQLIIDIDADNKNNNGNTMAILTIQLLDADNELEPFLTDQFAQLCLRCIKYCPYDLAASASRHSLILHHPQTLLSDLKLPQNTTQLSIRIELVLELETPLDNSRKNSSTTSDMHLLLNGKQWPIRNTMPWDANIDESDQDDDESGYDEHGKTLMEDDLDGDPFMDSMEDVLESTERSADKQLEEDYTSQNSTLVKSPGAVASTSTSTFSLATKSHLSDLKSTLKLDEQSRSVEPIKLEQPHSVSAPEDQNLPKKQQLQKKPEGKQVANDDEPQTTVLTQRRPPSSGKKINIPHIDPPEMLKAYQYFDALLHSNDWHVTQKPDQNNGFATIMKMDVDGHPTGVLLCETVWKHCSIWDAKAVLSCSEAREIWDSMFEKGEYICSVTPSCSIWHSKLKSAWPASPRDYVAFTAQYTSSQRVDICSTSCIGNTYEHYHLPKETSDFVRATLDLSGWRLDRLDTESKDSDNSTIHNIDGKKTHSNSISVRYVLQTHFQGWIPWYLLNQLTTQAPNVPTSAYQYLERYGAPPCVEELIMATIQQHRYDHTKKNWRLEYTRSITTGEQGPTTVTVRVDRRRWAFQSSSGGSHYNITVDPPPSNVVAEARKEDPYGIWLVIEHDESFIIPRRGKILVLIKPGSYQQHQVLQKKKKSNPITLMINGTTAPIQNDTTMATIGPLDSVDLNEKELAQSTKTPHHQNPSLESASPKTATTTSTTPSLSLPITTPNTEDEMAGFIRNLEVTPVEQAQAALLYLKRMDEQFGWSVVSDKQGLRINKRSGAKSSSATAKSKPTPSSSSTTTNSNTTTAPFSEPTSTGENTARPTSQLENHYLDVCDPCMIYKSSKVIENYSIEEVASVVTNISELRSVYDSSLEKCEMVKPIQRGCQVIRQEIKGIFPFKSRELYLVSCTAVEQTIGASSSKRILYVESSIDIPVIKSSKLPRGKMFISGWILEPIDPYTTATNHPIPSTRATYVIALDLGPSVPSYLSNMSASGIVSKKIHGVEQYLKQKGPLPYLVYPLPVVGFRKNKCVDIQSLVDDEDSNGFASSSNNSNMNNTCSNKNTSKKDADKAIYPPLATTVSTTASTMTSARMTTLRWCDIQTIYCQEPVLTVKSQCQYQQPPPPTTPRSATTSSFATPPSSILQQSSSPISIQPTASQSASWMDRRHSSTSTTYSPQGHRRGSMPPGSPTSSAVAAAAMVAATKQRKIELENSTHTSNTSSATSILVDPILCEVIVDLQMFSQGYDVMVNFRQHQKSNNTYDTPLCDENDLSGLLSVTISELTPTPSHILLATMDSSTAPPGKHSVQVKLVASSLSQTTLFQPKDKDMFDLELTLQHHQPAVTKMMKDSATTSAATTKSNLDEHGGKDRLTMSDILGDDDDDDDGTKQKTGSDSTSGWQGVVFVDGQLVSKYGEEIKVKSKRKPISGLQTLIEDRYKKSVPLPSYPDSTNSDYRNKNNKNIDSSTTTYTGNDKHQQHGNLDSDDHQSEDTSSVSTLESATSSVIAEPAPYLGEGVVSAALDGVNDFRMRLMFPFKNHHPSSSTSTSTPATLHRTALSIDTSDRGQATNKYPQSIDEDDKKINDNKSPLTQNDVVAGNGFEQINDIYPSGVTATAQQGTLCTLQMVMSIAVIGLCILCVMALVLLQPRIVVFEAGQPIYSLCRFPWFGGWQIQLVASESSSFTMT